jgi:hypothetical protein
MEKGIIYVGFVVGVIIMELAIAYDTSNQQNYILEGSELAPTAEQD